MIWQLHVYGAPCPGIAEWCEASKVLLTLFQWDKRYAEAGLAQDGVYLIRPDSYVALAVVRAVPQTLEKYFVSRQLTP
jgi:hypothetical protein